MSKLGIARLVIDFAVGSSTGYCVRSMIRNAVQPETTEEQIKLVIGSMALGSLIVQRTNEHVNNSIDRAVEFWENHQAQKEEAATNS